MQSGRLSPSMMGEWTQRGGARHPVMRHSSSAWHCGGRCCGSPHDGLVTSTRGEPFPLSRLGQRTVSPLGPRPSSIDDQMPGHSLLPESTAILSPLLSTPQQGRPDCVS